MPPIAPSEFPPPFDSESVISRPTDPEDERIEVGVAIVGAGPAGMACAVKMLQLLEDRPELTEKLGEVPVAVMQHCPTCPRSPLIQAPGSQCEPVTHFIKVQPGPQGK